MKSIKFFNIYMQIRGKRAQKHNCESLVVRIIQNDSHTVEIWTQSEPRWNVDKFRCLSPICWHPNETPAGRASVLSPLCGGTGWRVGRPEVIKRQSAMTLVSRQDPSSLVITYRGNELQSAGHNGAESCADFCSINHLVSYANVSITSQFKPH